MFAEPSSPTIRIGISSCLLGQNVRYDGGHKHDRFLTDVLGKYVQFVPVCPEVEVGMGTPREPIQLVAIGGEVRLLGVDSRVDHTAAMKRYARKRVRQLAALNLSGYVLKKDSPSCGMERVKVYRDDLTTGGRQPASGRPVRRGRGLFAEALLKGLPNLPVEEEGRLGNLALRENWIERVFAYQRLKAFWASRWRIADLLAFHRAHKYALLAHAPRAYGELGRLLTAANSLPRRTLRQKYETAFMAALRRLATPIGHANVLESLAGPFIDRLDSQGRRELTQTIEDYRRGRVPLVMPQTLIAHHVRRLGIESLSSQTYLNPNPVEFLLRNHA